MHTIKHKKNQRASASFDYGVVPPKPRLAVGHLATCKLTLRPDLTRNLSAAATVCLVLCFAISSLSEINPYAETIVTRNVFGLKDPPPPAPPADTTPPAPKITLVGIANVFGVKKAVLKPQPAPGTPAKAPVAGQPPAGQEAPLVLTEGAMQDGITVVSIDEANGIVKVDNNGQSLSLSFDKDGMKAPSGPAVSAPGQPGLPGQLGIPRPPGMPGAVTAAGVNPVQPGVAVPTATQAAGFSGATGVQAGVGSAAPVAVGGGIALPSQGGLPQRPVRTMSPEEYAVMYEVNREKSRALIESGQSTLPVMPPHAFFRDTQVGGGNQPRPR
jgi:hypothetical protein